MTRVFDAPRELVFKAMTDPTLIPKWWGPRAYCTKVDKMDSPPVIRVAARTGGRFSTPL
jgi:uncharacterized protein YndB with AHSA1/START domain